MSYLVIDLQRSALDEHVSINNLLRKSLVVAKKLKLKDFEEWINNEVNGYERVDKIPNYRKIKGQLKGFNPYSGWIYTQVPDNKMEDMLTKRPVINSISSLEYLITSNESGELTMDYPAEQEALLGKMFGFETKYSLFIDKAQFKGIIEKVRTIILNWALELEDDGILGEEMIFTAQEREIAVERNYTVNNFYGNVSESQIQQNTRESSQS